MNQPVFHGMREGFCCHCSTSCLWTIQKLSTPCHVFVAWWSLFVIDATKEKRHRTELRFHLETPQGSSPQVFPREIDVKTVKMLGWCTPIFWCFLYALKNVLIWSFMFLYVLICIWSHVFLDVLVCSYIFFFFCLGTTREEAVTLLATRVLKRALMHATSHHPRTYRQFISDSPDVPRGTMDISSTSSVRLLADADFVSSPMAFRVQVASDADRSDPFFHFTIAFGFMFFLDFFLL